MVRPLFRSKTFSAAQKQGGMRGVVGVAFIMGTALLLVGGTSSAAGTLRGRITGQDKLIPDVFAEAAKPEAHRYTWREPSPTVRPDFRTLSAMPSRDICITVANSTTPPAMPPLLVRVTGGRTAQSTYVVTPGTKLVFENRDPFPHRLVQKDWKGEINAGAQREWIAPGAGRFEFRDELYPSLRTYVVVEPQVVATVYPGRDGAFALGGLSSGEYIVKAYFQGKQVGKQLSLLVKDKLPTDIKEPLNVGEGGDAK